MRFSSVVGAGIALVLLLTLITAAGYRLWTTSNETERVLLARKATGESLAFQVASLAQQQDSAAIETALREVVESDPDILSAAVRRSDGTLLAVQGDHGRNWSPPSGDYSTPINLQVPIFAGTGRWATVEMCFTPISSWSFMEIWRGSPGDS